MRLCEQNEERIHERALLQILYKQAEQQRRRPVYSGFHQVVRKLLQDGLYGQWIYNYSASEIKWLGLQIVAERDRLIPSAQLQQYMNEFVTSDYHDKRIGLPQERLMLIAMGAMQNETVQRLQKVQEAYWMLSHGYVTLPAEIMSFFGKTFYQRKTRVQQYTMDIADDRIASFLSSKVKEKHIRIPDHFMEQVKACGSWSLFDAEQIERIFGCSFDNFNSERFSHAADSSSMGHKKVSAIGLMKRLLGSEGIVVHFPNKERQEKAVLCSYIQLPYVLQETELARTCTILVRLLNGIESIWGRTIQIEVAGWETAIAEQKIALHSERALLFIEEVAREINRSLEVASCQSGMNTPLRKAASVMHRSIYQATKQQQIAMIDRITAEQRHTDQGGSVTLEKSATIETAELLQLLIKAWSCGIPEVRLI
ncbi:hypothetical protein CSV80_10020 [Sporosarcina sp. P12(2017)]|uniref:ribonucleotide reductase N-terminal alpha domain-containing protein n=1 Tax=unclassified Sporosarcina TaxID=2647733 RepID=UPI000C172A96|nr:MULTISPECIES: ribonucleotide reductase N-terminal alpha domain-containing protein [unclassified Sporosarcina]PIC57311.1 hypothetical protein CSV81_10350 [Sporosarcina sp. P10]PIC60693.1 hypothetical protein CSV80_10020 [Sporosarcina sp. P12(2017)]